MKKTWILAIIVIVVLAIGFIFGGNEENIAASPARTVAVEDIARRADDLPPPITRTENTRVVVELEATQVVAKLDDGVTYEYWTYNNQVPGPFIRVLEGDTVEVRLTHAHGHGDDQQGALPGEHTFAVGAFPVAYADEGHSHDEMPANSEAAPATTDGHMMSAGEMAHMAEGHGEHSVDLHAVIGPGGGADLSRAGPNETKAFEFVATRPGLYVYHCASPHVPTHIANGMYGLILVEPKGGLPKVDREFYVAQAELYTSGKKGEKGHQLFSKEKLLAEAPEYFVFNGRVGALTEDGALRANTGETIRIYFAVPTHIASNFHIIGEIFDRLYREGDLLSPPALNVQTTMVPAGGSMAVEMKLEQPGTYLLVDHSLTRSIDKGALGKLIVGGAYPWPPIYRSLK